MARFELQISFLLLFMLFAIIFNKSVVSSNRMIRCNENDERLLSIFKQGVLDPNNQLSSWTIDEEDCCSWEGVYCNNITRRVTKLSLLNHELRGEINLCLLQLEFLNHLDLSDNHFKTVSIPPSQISKFPLHAHKFQNQSLSTPSSNESANFSVALRYLNLSFNGLAINDLHWLSQLFSLKYLDLSGSDIGNENRWLQYIAMLPSLSELHLSGCELSDFPSLDYVNFTSLEVLDLSFNYDMKSKLPNSFFNITNHIYHLDLHMCSLHSQLPNSLLNLQNLKYVDLSYNNLEGSITNWLGHYEQLQYLDIERNLFSGIIPSSLGNISSLFHLGLSYNRLSGNLPETLVKLHNLNQLHIGHNFLVGVITEKNLSNFSKLTSLDLGSTSFEFSFDPEWVPPFQLEALDMSNARIGPNVPTWLYTQRSLQYLDISGSRISKIEGDVFWRFVAGIEEVHLSNNSIGDDISNVILSGNISYFYASHNSLSGSIVSLFCHQKSNGDLMLHDLDLSYNHVSGALPDDCWVKWPYLNSFNLGSNKLTGKVPPSMDSLVNLQHLDLSHNNFFGKFSLDLSNLTALNYLILEQNKFSGNLPTNMQQELFVIKLRGNQFIGNIPSELCNLTRLAILDLADNKLSGPIPHCLSKIMQPIEEYFPVDEVKVFVEGRELDYSFFMLDSRQFVLMRSIDLSSNNLSGEIPKELFNLTQIFSLNLSWNHLIGKLPEEIGGMKELEYLDLSYNNFSGEIPSTISDLSFLSYLNLSYNNFIGQIPSGSQIQSFDLWSFVGNDLCGDPLPNKCHKKEAPYHSKRVDENEDGDFLKSLYLGTGVGFASGFWGVCGSLFLIRSWRHKFFRWFGHIADQLYVSWALSFKRFG